MPSTNDSTPRRRTRRRPPVITGRQVPYDAELELAVLGGILMGYAGGGTLAAGDFYVPAHQRLFVAILQVPSGGPPAPEVVTSYLPFEDRPLVTEALTVAMLPVGLADGAVRLIELAQHRERAALLEAELDELAPPTLGAEQVQNVGEDPAKPGRLGRGEKPQIGIVEGPPRGYFAGGQYLDVVDRHPSGACLVGEDGKTVFTWVPHVEAAYLDGQAHYRVRVGLDSAVVTAQELRDKSAWDRFPSATGRAGKMRPEMLADLVVAMGAPMMERVVKARWDAERFLAPMPDAVEALGLRALAGYGKVGAGARVEDWRSICGELADCPRLALYVGGAVGGLYLPVAGLEHHLSPLGFVVHAVGEGGTGKTTAQHVAAAVLGDPRYVTRTWSASRLGLPALTAGVGELPLVLSDTSTWSGAPGELADTVMRILEGPRSISTRTGELDERGTAYRSVLLSSGNASITSAASGTPIMRRVLEIASPLTLDAAQAVRLKMVAADSYGWPFARAREGALTPAHFRELVAAAQHFLPPAPDDPAVVVDVAMRCAVLAAGAAGLVELCAGDEPLLDAVFGAAIAAGSELLADLRAALEEQHRPVADELYAAVWHWYRARWWAFPAPGERETDRVQVEGWLANTGTLYLLPATLKAVCAGVNIADYVPALRELRSRGLLHAHGERRLTGELNLSQTEKVRGLYVFEAPADENPARNPAPTPRVTPRVGNGSDQETPRDPARDLTHTFKEGPEQLPSTGDPGSHAQREPAPPALDSRDELPSLHDAGPPVRGAPTGQQDVPGLWQTDDAGELETGAGAVPAVREPSSQTAGAAIVCGPRGCERVEIPRPVDRQVVVAMDADGWAYPGIDPSPWPAFDHFGELADWLLEGGALSVWLTASALERLKLPSDVTPCPFGEGLPHPMVRDAVLAGWDFVRPSKVPGLAPLMVLRRGRATVEIRCPSWRDEHEHQWPHFGRLELASTLAQEVYNLQQALWPGRGWRLNFGPISSFRALASSLDQRRHELVPPERDFPSIVNPELPTWARWPPGHDYQGFAVAFDRNRSFLAALGTVQLAVDQPGPLAAATNATSLERWANRAGYVLCDVHGAAGVANILQPEGRQGPLWLPTSILGIALEEPATFGQLRATEARLALKSTRWFRPVTDRIAKGLELLASSPAAAAELKRIYSKGVTVLSERRYCQAGQEQWYRPDWKAQILGEHTSNTIRALRRAQVAGARLIGTGARDTAIFVVDEPDALPAGLVVGTTTGAWKRKGQPILAGPHLSGVSFADMLSAMTHG